MILYPPLSSVRVERDFSISAGLLASTETPGRTAPLWSFTRPVKALCATPSGTNAARHTNETKTPITTGIVLDFFIPLLLLGYADNLVRGYYFAIRIYAEAARVNRQNAQRLAAMGRTAAKVKVP